MDKDIQQKEHWKKYRDKIRKICKMDSGTEEPEKKPVFTVPHPEKRGFYRDVYSSGVPTTHSTCIENIPEDQVIYKREEKYKLS